MLIFDDILNLGQNSIKLTYIVTELKSLSSNDFFKSSFKKIKYHQQPAKNTGVDTHAGQHCTL